MRPRVARTWLKAEDVALETKPEKVRCRSCGVSLPKGQVLKPGTRYYICSYCIGDPFWGEDGYLRDIIADELAGGVTLHRKNQLQLIMCAPTRQQRRLATRLAFDNGVRIHVAPQ